MKNTYEIKNGVAYIYGYYKGEEQTVLVDVGTLEELIMYTKTTLCMSAKKTKSKIYINPLIRWNINKRTIKLYLHHAVIGKPPKGYVVDHINRNPLDNRRENLRFVTVAENAWNQDLKPIRYNDRHSTNERFIIHDTFGKRNIYKVKVIRNKEIIYIGSAYTLSEAIEIRDKYLEDGTMPEKRVGGHKSPTGEIGITLTKSGKYKAIYTYKRKKYNAGLYPTLEKAVEARKEFIKNFNKSFKEENK